MSFDSFSFHSSITAGIKSLGYATPTPIQAQAIPPILQGRDIIGLAQTGTGKTAAFVLPILNRLIQGQRSVVRALVISPTRELAEQTNEAFTNLGWKTGLRSVSVYGGVGFDQQNRKLRDGVEIVVACPGRLLDHLWKGNIDLQHLEVLVIDEADRMFDMGFLPDIKNILMCILKPHQTLLFSATMPEDIKKLVKEILHNPVTVQIGRIAPAASVSHALYPIKQNLKTELLIKLLHDTAMESVLVFARTKYRVERLADQLCRKGFKATSLQGNMSQFNRQASLDGFRSGRYKIMVATDIASRGIDVENISHVVNYDMPETTDDYTHRIGRTGRVDKTGEAFSFVTGEDMPTVRSLERILNTTIERRTVFGFDLGSAEPEKQSGLTGRGSSPARYRMPPRRKAIIRHPTT